MRWTENRLETGIRAPSKIAKKASKNEEKILDE